MVHYLLPPIHSRRVALIFGVWIWLDDLRLVALLETPVARTVKNSHFHYSTPFALASCRGLAWTTSAWLIRTLALRLRSRRTAVQVHDSYIFDVVVRSRNSFRHGVSLRHCALRFSRDPAQTSAFLRKMTTHFLSSCARPRWSNSPASGSAGRRQPDVGKFFGR